MLEQMFQQSLWEQLFQQLLREYKISYGGCSNNYFGNIKFLFVVVPTNFVGTFVSTRLAGTLIIVAFGIFFSDASPKTRLPLLKKCTAPFPLAMP